MVWSGLWLKKFESISQVFKSIGNMRPLIILWIVATLSLASNSNPYCSATDLNDTSLMPTDDPAAFDSLENYLIQSKVNPNKVDLKKLHRLEAKLEHYELTNDDDKYTTVLDELQDLIELAKLPVSYCGELELGKLGRFAGLLQAAQDTRGAKGDERKVDVIMRKLLERQLEDGTCTYQLIEDGFEVQLEESRTKPTLMDRLKKDEMIGFFGRDSDGEHNFEIIDSKWPAVFKRLAGDDFPRVYRKRKVSIKPLQLRWTKYQASEEKFLDYFEKKLAKICHEYNNDDLGKYALVGPFIELFMPNDFDQEHLLPKFFGQRKELFSTLLYRTALCQDLINLDDNKLKEIFNSLVTEGSKSSGHGSSNTNKAKN